MPVRSVRQGPGDQCLALLVIVIAGLQPPLGRGGAVAHAAPPVRLLVGVLKAPAERGIIRAKSIRKS